MKSGRIDIPVFILTAYGDEKIAAESIKTGAYDYISKEILGEADAPDIIIESISAAIQRHRAYKEKRRALRSLEMSEARYKSLIENSPILILRFLNDRDKMISSVNNGFCSYFKTTHHTRYWEKSSLSLSTMKKKIFCRNRSIHFQRQNRFQPSNTFMKLTARENGRYGPSRPYLTSVVNTGIPVHGRGYHKPEKNPDRTGRDS
jgi:CheY-like chemotaxis protein